MIGGHFATAIAAKQSAPTGHIAFYLAASQAQDLAWPLLGLLGLSPMHDHNAPVSVEWVISHDLVPTLGWMGVALIAGRGLFGAWRPGIAAALLVALHLICDLAAGYPHYVMGPQSPVLGTGMYLTAPTLAVAIEAVFAAALLGWVWTRDRAAGHVRSRATWIAWAVVFGGGIGGNLVTAENMATFEAAAPLGVPLALGLLALYGSQIALLTWAEAQPMGHRLPPGVAVE